MCMSRSPPCRARDPCGSEWKKRYTANQGKIEEEKATLECGGSTPLWIFGVRWLDTALDLWSAVARHRFGSLIGVGRTAWFGPPSLRTGRADLPHPALQLVIIPSATDTTAHRQLSG